MRSAGWVLLTATSVTDPGARPAASAAAAILAPTAKRLLDTSNASDDWFTIRFPKPFDLDGPFV